MRLSRASVRFGGCSWLSASSASSVIFLLRVIIMAAKYYPAFQHSRIPDMERENGKGHARFMPTLHLSSA